MMTLETLPQSITIIGGGVIGLEFASFFSSVGVTVHIIEAGPRILPTENAQISQLIQNNWKSKVSISISIRCSKETTSNKATRK